MIHTKNAYIRRMHGKERIFRSYKLIWASYVKAILLCLLMLGSGASSQVGGKEKVSTNIAGNPGLPPGQSDLGSSTNFNDLGDWIWDKKTFDRQTVRFWHAFEIPRGANIKSARVRLTVDNSFKLYLDGNDVGRGDEWRDLFDYDLVRVLRPGKHVIAVEAYNSSDRAAFVFGMGIELADGRDIQLKSDETWWIAPNNAHHWTSQPTPGADWTPATGLPIEIKRIWTEHVWKGTKLHWPERINRVPTLEPVLIPFWRQNWFQIMLLLTSVLAIFSTIRLMAKLALHANEQQLLQNERTRIAKDIHDDLGARMTHLVLEGEVGASESPPGTHGQAAFHRISEEAREALSAMHEILWALNPKQDSIRDFAAYICRYAQNFFKSSRIQCLLDVDENLRGVAINLPLRRNLYLAVKESLSNVLNHSEATEVTLSIHRRGESLTVVVQDNGRGFHPTQTNPGGNGLANLQIRMREVGGDFEIKTQIGEGCRVKFTIPISNVRRPPWWLKSWRGRSQIKGLVKIFLLSTTPIMMDILR